MENEKKLPAASQELPDETLDAIAGGAGSQNGNFVFKPGTKVKFTWTDNDKCYLNGVVRYGYLKEYNGRMIPHYAITVNHYSGSTMFRDVPQHRIIFAL